jgi:hypothetical protein
MKECVKSRKMKEDGKGMKRAQDTSDEGWGRIWLYSGYKSR